MKKIITLLLVLISIASAEYPAPAGFKWGTRSEAIPGCATNMGEPQPNKGTNCVVYKAPKDIPWVNSYLLVFHKNKLVKVLLESKSTVDDITGSENVELYNKVKETLSGKYGEPAIVYERMFNKLYQEYDEFYECLAYSGCGIMASLWVDQADSTVISTEISTAGRRGQGYVKVGYESLAFGKYIDERKAEEEEATNEGL